MRKTIRVLVMSVAAVLLVSHASWAGILTLEFTDIWMDHQDTLYLSDTSHTLQWYYHGQYEPVGLWPGRSVAAQIPMHVTIMDGASVLMDQDWSIWTAIPTYWTPAWSSTLAIPDLPFESITSFSYTLTGRDDKWLYYGLGDQGLSIEFYDPDGEAAYYTAKFSAEYTSSDVPESGSVAMLCTGILALAAGRRLPRIRGRSARNTWTTTSTSSPFASTVVAPEPAGSCSTDPSRRPSAARTSTRTHCFVRRAVAGALTGTPASTSRRRWSEANSPCGGYVNWRAAGERKPF